MQFTLVAILSLVAIVAAGPIRLDGTFRFPQSLDFRSSPSIPTEELGLGCHTTILPTDSTIQAHSETRILTSIPKTDITARSPQVEAEAAAMSDASGNVIAFDSTAVYQGPLHSSFPNPSPAFPPPY